MESAKPIPLDYAPSDLMPRWSKAAIAAFVLGIISGPVGICLSVSPIAGNSSQLATCVFYGVLFAAFAFGAGAAIRVDIAAGHLRGMRLALAGMAIAVLWGIAVPLLSDWALQGMDA